MAYEIKKSSKPRQVRGTTAYKYRNWFVFGVFAASGLSWLLFEQLPGTKKIKEKIYSGYYDRTDEENYRLEMIKRNLNPDTKDLLLRQNEILSKNDPINPIKPTSTLPPDTSDKFQKPTIINSVKSEYLPNDSVVSESGSFVEVLNAAQSLDQKTSMSQNVFKSFSSDENVSNIIKENKQCPVCSQMLDDKYFINHVKSCGTTHNLSSETLIKAVDLQERQAAEREALGLPKLTKNKDVKKKRNINTNKHSKLKIGVDSNLDLAIAMSKSLQESKEAEIIKESETLLEAGLENEAIQKRKTLENFGFVSNQPVKCKPKASKTNSILFKQTKEDREKRITEKVAMILIDSDTDASTLEIPVNCSHPIIGSTYLNKIRNIDNKLWKKSLLDEETINEFYVHKLSKFIKPSEINIYSDLTKDFQFPVLTNTPIEDPHTSNEEFLCTLNKEKENSNCIYTPITSHNIIGNKTMQEHSTKWESMVDNQFMSDITIFAKDEREISAHTLVLYVQCPDILDDIITEDSDTCKSKKMIMWLEYSYEACLAFLKFIYSGQKSFIDTECREDYLSLGTRYNILVDINVDENHGWVVKELDNISKRKSTEFDSTPTSCKRFKASSPDMFMSDDMSKNFLGTAVNDEQTLSMLKTKQWLHSCNSSQKLHHSSFTGNQIINSPPTILPDKSPSHSFHSASTISLPLSYISNHTDSKNRGLCINSSPNIDKFSPKLLSIGESSLKSISIIEHKSQCTPNASSPLLPDTSTLTNLHKEPELITIDSDSESESIDIILSSTIKKSFNSNTFLKNNCSFISSKNENNISVIELNDNSSDSINLSSSNVLYHKNDTTKSNHSLVHSLSITPKNTTFLNDELSVFSATTNVLSTNNLSTQELPSNNHKTINLVEDSLDSVSIIKMSGTAKNDYSRMSVQISWNNNEHISQNPSTSFSNVMSQIDSISKCQTINSSLNLSLTKNDQLINFPFTYGSGNYSQKNDEDLNLNSIDSLVKRNLFECDHSKPSINNVSNNENKLPYKSTSDLTLLENNTRTKLSSNKYDDSFTNTNKVVDLTSCPSSNYIKEQNTFKPISIQVEPTQLSEINNTTKITIPNENIYEQNKSSDFEQIIDDPWIDYNDWQPDNMSSHNVSPVLLESEQAVLVDTSEVMTPNKDVCNVNLVQTPTFINNSYRINSQKKNAVTPNKYGSRLNTPKSLRRVQSESIIGSKEVTPLPDYSIMKTPDLRKEFDRYGLKDLGRRKGKLLLRHIYDVLHPSHISEKTKYNIDSEQHSDSSDCSEHGIPDYECENFDEIETFSQTNSMNKISIEMGFKQLIELNEDLHMKILCYEPIWIEEIKEDLKQYNVNISMQKLITFLDDKCITFRSKSLTDQRQKTLAKRNTKRKKLF